MPMNFSSSAWREQGRTAQLSGAQGEVAQPRGSNSRRVAAPTPGGRLWGPHAAPGKEEPSTVEEMAALSSSAKCCFAKVKRGRAGLRTVTHCGSVLTSPSEGPQNNNTPDHPRHRRKQSRHSLSRVHGQSILSNCLLNGRLHPPHR